MSTANTESLAARVGDTLKFWGFRTASWLSGRVPLRFTYWVAARVGDIIYLFWHEHSGNAVSNMLRVLGPDAPPAKVRYAARKSFHNYIQVLADFLRVPQLDPAEIEREVEGSGWEHLEAARRAGKGAIIVACHSGNWDFAGALVGKYKLPLTAVADPFRPKRLDDFVIAQRQRMGVNTIPVDPAAMRKLFEALRRNEIIILHVDRPIPGEGVEVQFFGESAWVPSGPAAIALKTGAAIVPGYFIRRAGGRGFIGAFDRPLDYKALLTGDKAQDIQRITQEIMAYMEGVIRHSPTQWYMFRRMWPRIDLRERRFGVVSGSWQRSRAVIQRWRRRRAVPSGATVEGLSMGISVDPPVIEEWASGHGHSPEDGPPPAPVPHLDTARPRPADKGPVEA